MKWSGFLIKIYHRIIKEDRTNVNFLVMDITISYVLLNFENDNPSIQKISLVNNTNYNPSYSTSVGDPLTTKSFYTKTAVLFDSADTVISSFPPHSPIILQRFLIICQAGFSATHPTLILKSDAMIEAQYPSRFLQDVQTISLI